MELTEQQLVKLRAPFEEAGVFKGCSENEIRKRLEEIADIYVTLVKINLRIKKEASINNEK